MTVYKGAYMGFSGAGFGIELGDKLHKNFMASGVALANRAQAGQELDEEKRQFDKDYALKQMVAQLQAQGMQKDLNWAQNFRRGMMK